MIILANKQQTLQQKVNSLGKYLYKNLSGAYNFHKSSNMFDVYTVVLYQIPIDIIKTYNLKDVDVHEMEINISITTYSDKIRVNFVEISPEELTLGHQAYSLDKYPTYKDLKDAIMWYLKDRLEKRYENYDFLF